MGRLFAVIFFLSFFSLSLYSQSENKISVDSKLQFDGASFFGLSDSQTKIADGIAIRRARVALSAVMSEDWKSTIEIDFAAGKIQLLDANLAYSGLENFEFKIGNMKENFSMDCLTSSFNLPFLESSMSSDAFAPSFHLGTMGIYQNRGLNASVGLFFQPISSASVADEYSSLNKQGIYSGHSLTGRVFYNPFYSSEDYALHIGAALSYRKPAPLISGKYGNISFDSRSGSYINNKKYLSTGSITGVENTSLAGTELAFYYKGLRFQSEYIHSQTAIKESDPFNFNGYYLYAGYMLFGGKHKYDAKSGRFSRPSLGNDWGDLEILARYDYVNLNHRDVKGGSCNAFTLGLNYYINKNVRFMLNYQYNNHDVAVDYHTTSFRIEVDF